MVEDIRLQVFIRYPGCGCREEIQFQRYTVIGRLKLAHHASHIMIHPRMALQVTIQISTEDTKIRLATTIHKDGVIDMIFSCPERKARLFISQYTASERL